MRVVDNENIVGYVILKFFMELLIFGERWGEGIRLEKKNKLKKLDIGKYYIIN